MAPGKSARDISREHLERLRLPLDVPGFSIEAQAAFELVGEVLYRIRTRKPLSSYQQQWLPSSLEKLLKALCPNDERAPQFPQSAEQVKDWIAWLQNLTPIRSAMAVGYGPKAILRLLKEFEQSTLVDDVGRIPTGAIPRSLSSLKRDTFDLQLSDGPWSLIWCVGLGPEKFRTVFRLDIEIEDARPRVPSASRLIVNRALFEGEDAIVTEFDGSALSSVESISPDEVKGDLFDFLARLEERWPTVIEGQSRWKEIPALFGAKASPVVVWVIPDQSVPGTLAHGVLKRLTVASEWSVPVTQIVDPNAATRRNVSVEDARRDLFIGLMDSRSPAGRQAFALDSSQRLAAMSASELLAGEGVLAINGPPGTGKTAFLRSVLASAWVETALNGAERPLRVFATGFTNRSVANVIEAFSGIADEAPTAGQAASFATRWIAGLPSYGWLTPSGAAAKDAADLMQLRWQTGTVEQQVAGWFPEGAAAGFAEQLRSDVRTSIELYVSSARESLHRETLELNTAVVELRRRLITLIEQMRSEQVLVRSLLAELSSAQAERKSRKEARQQRRSAALELGERRALLNNELTGAIKRLASVKAAGDAVTPPAGRTFLQRVRLRFSRRAREEWFRQRRNYELDRRAAQLAAAGGFVVGDGDPDRVLASMRDRLASDLAHVDDDLRRIGLDDDRDLAQTIAIKSLAERLRSILPNVSPRRIFRPAYVWDALDRRQDLEYRIQAFHLSARYWEGRWLQKRAAVERELTESGGDLRLLEVLAADDPSYLGVVQVGTTHMLSISLSRGEPADLLILDEAGQCPLTNAVALAGLTRRLIVVGDVHQLAPIVPGNAATLAAAAQKIGFTALNKLPAALDPVSSSGQLAGQAATILSDGERDPGILLRFHYRCTPLIAEYFNELCYEGAMRPVRRRDEVTPAGSIGIAPMTWIDCRGAISKRGTSSVNMAQATEAVEWVAENAEALVAAYGGKPLGLIVGLIAPFKAQAEVLRARAKSLLGGMASDMTIGTVHALQGAERPIVIFTLTQSLVGPDSVKSLFADASGPSVMNVAVSRARDAFVLVGDRATYRPSLQDRRNRNNDAAATRRAIDRLGAYLIRHGSALYPQVALFIEAHGKAASIRKALGRRVAVIATGGHFEKSVLERDGLSWTDLPNASDLDRQINTVADIVRKVIIASDDDEAGELIAYRLIHRLRKKGISSETLRARIPNLEPEAIRRSLATADGGLDESLLRTALRREFARHVDVGRYPRDIPYFTPSQRAIVQMVQKRPSKGTRVHVRMTCGTSTFVGTVVEGEGFAQPRSYVWDFGEMMPEMLSGAELEVVSQSTALRQLPPYPASTTHRILAQCAWELGLAPWDAMETLQALYLQSGSRANT